MSSKIHECPVCFKVWHCIGCDTIKDITICDECKEKDLKTNDHPCKETCSGWKQGYEAGVMAERERCAKIVVINLDTKEDDFKYWMDVFNLNLP